MKSVIPIVRSLCAAFVIMLMVLSVANASTPTDKEQLGKFIFFDTNLSSRGGQGCVSCHSPDTGFADPDQDVATSAGVMPLRFGVRNAPTAKYQAAWPDFTADDPLIPGLPEGAFKGGMFWDGRAANLVEQAKGPFLNPVEMHNPNKFLVVHDIKKADYAKLFKQVYGDDIFSNVENAYNAMADAIAAFEKSPEMNPFNSKFDLVLKGEATFTDQEARGFALFSAFGRTNCLTCHDIITTTTNQPFTDFRYFNIGLPKNMENPFYTTIPSINPDGSEFKDLGLGGALQNKGEYPDLSPQQMGAFKVPTLRNIAETAPYMHNGIFKDLKTVVHFYNTRDVSDEFGDPEVDVNIVGRSGPLTGFIGNMGLTSDEEDDIVAFLKTLTDDYEP
ncbi:MAG: cytochrome c peroxidase [Armatimonadota bacterium]|nr:c-type cytochrome [bacterium]